MNKESFIIKKFTSHYIGDDAACIDGFCYSCDSFFEDIHFKREWMSMAQIGRKAMLVNISDAVAMNAKPFYALVALTLPNNISENEINALTGALELCAKEFGCEIIGGDTIAAEKIGITITVISKSDNPLLRVGLQEGDLLAFTGTLGQSKCDLEKLFLGQSIEDESRFFEPSLRADFVAKTREYLTVGMDISDGLFCDTNKLLDLNDVGLELLIDIDDAVGESGEEYEMLVGFKKHQLPHIQDICKILDLKFTPFAKAKKDGMRFECKEHHFVDAL
ncbi:MAG: thiamine-phosphate kinase [Campylobacterales bacterium]|nr:thiamine-phosphate kinase [Campylobacterales bacterium]